jgi:hypothetical protein
MDLNPIAIKTNCHAEFISAPHRIGELTGVNLACGMLKQVQHDFNDLI